MRAARQHQRHRPESTPLHAVVRDHLETFLAAAREDHGKALPRYVEAEMRAYLACGILAHGFLRARCNACGKDLLVAFSCKRRGACPSCNARRMCGTAAHLVDHVVPAVPVRQWVLSVPFELRLLLARNPRALSAVGRIFVQEVARWQRDQADAAGVPWKRTRAGAICFPQRFGGSLNLNVHFHVAVPDGVFTRAARSARADFRRVRAPDREDLDTVALNVSVRSLAWLRRRGLVLDEPPDTPEESGSALDACLAASLGIGDVTALPAGRPGKGPTGAGPARSGSRSGQDRGFDVHAGVVVEAHDRAGRERLFRYCARPPLSLERLAILPDGRIAYELRKPWGRATHRVMTPLQFLARLAALIPPPRHPLIRFHGVFAPHSSWRKSVVPAQAPCRPPEAPICDRTPAPQTEAPRAGSRPALGGTPCSTPGPACVPRAEAAPSHAALLALRPPLPYIPWAELLRRTHDVDAL
ncbi:MAG: transposase, partial [Deltaproteobacteria bacterium]|nr:transposase [Deltaproteobacteria bacterium]